MSHLVIDGYNYVSRLRSSALHGETNLDALRQALLGRLAGYKKRKALRITVVFDAYNSPLPGRQREQWRGVDVVYSGAGETADEVIIDWIRQRPAGLVVVSSDRAILDEAKRRGVSFLTPVKLEQMIAESPAEQAEMFEERTLTAGKRGNPRKLPKKIRRAVKRIHKI
jgi:predicted RNA-binding protein with PIN domain